MILKPHVPSLGSRGPRSWQAGACAIVLALLATFFPLSAEQVSLRDCPMEVQATILKHLREGKLNEIQRIQIESHVLYIVEFDIKGFRDGKLHISGTGQLRKSVEEIRANDLPPAVRTALDPYLKGRAHIDDVERVISEGTTRYHVEIEQPREPDRHLVFEEDGRMHSAK